MRKIEIHAADKTDGVDKNTYIRERIQELLEKAEKETDKEEARKYRKDAEMLQELILLRQGNKDTIRHFANALISYLSDWQLTEAPIFRENAEEGKIVYETIGEAIKAISEFTDSKLQ